MTTLIYEFVKIPEVNIFNCEIIKNHDFLRHIPAIARPLGWKVQILPNQVKTIKNNITFSIIPDELNNKEFVEITTIVNDKVIKVRRYVSLEELVTKLSSI